MTTSLPPEFFSVLKESLLDDCIASVATHANGHDGSPVYAFVLRYNPIQGDVSWLCLTHRTQSELDQDGFTSPPGHPDGWRFDFGSRELDGPAERSRTLLQAYADCMAVLTYEGPSELLEETLVEVVTELRIHLDTLDTADDFVAFIADVDGADVDLVRKTVPKDVFKRVFVDA